MYFSVLLFLAAMENYYSGSKMAHAAAPLDIRLAVLVVEIRVEDSSLWYAIFRVAGLSLADFAGRLHDTIEDASLGRNGTSTLAEELRFYSR